MLKQLRKPDFNKYEKIQDRRLAHEFVDTVVKLFDEKKLDQQSVANAVKKILKEMKEDDESFANLVSEFFRTDYRVLNEKYKIA